MSAEKKYAFNIVEKHNGEFSVECIQEIVNETYVHIREIQILCVCYLLAKENHNHLETQEIYFAPEAPNNEIEELRNKMHSDSKKKLTKV